MNHQVVIRQPDTPKPADSVNLDEDDLARIRSALAKCAYYAVRRITWSMEGGLLTLSGRVPSYYVKQIAQTVVMDAVLRPTRIDNRLLVGD